MSCITPSSSAAPCSFLNARLMNGSEGEEEGKKKEEEEGGWVAQLLFMWTPPLLSHERGCGARLGFVSVSIHDH